MSNDELAQYATASVSIQIDTTVDGIPVPCRIRRSAEAFVLLPGVGGRTRLHLPLLLPTLARHRVLAVGFGNTDVATIQPLQLEQLRYLARVGTEVLLPGKNPCVLGGSLEGEVASALAVSFHAVKRLIPIAIKLQSFIGRQLFTGILRGPVLRSPQAAQNFSQLSATSTACLPARSIAEVEHTPLLKFSRFTDYWMEIFTSTVRMTNAARPAAETHHMAEMQDSVPSEQSRESNGAICIAFWLETENGHAIMWEHAAKFFSTANFSMKVPDQYPPESISSMVTP